MLEELLLKQMLEDPVISASLAQYQGQAAIFYQKAPMDEDPNWEGMSFPRLHYNLDFSFDPERNQAGTLTIDVWACSLNPPIHGRSPETAIGKSLEQSISGMFYSPVGEIPLCAIWKESVAFLGKATDNNNETSPIETFGLSVTFDLLSFPPQETFSADPIAGLNAWIKKQYPQILLVEELPERFRPTDQEPVVYWRMLGADMCRELFACTWYLGQFYGHISCGSVQERNRWARAISEEVRGIQDLVLDDGSFLRIEKSLFRHDGNPLSEGQVALWGEFGVLSNRYREQSQVPRLNHIYHEKKRGGIYDDKRRK